MRGNTISYNIYIYFFKSYIYIYVYIIYTCIILYLHISHFMLITGMKSLPPLLHLSQVQVVGTTELAKPRALPVEMAEWLAAASKANAAVAYVSILGVR